MPLVKSHDVTLGQALALVKAALPDEDEWYALREALRERRAEGRDDAPPPLIEDGNGNRNFLQPDWWRVRRFQATLPSTLIEHGNGNRIVLHPDWWRMQRFLADSVPQSDRQAILYGAALPFTVIHNTFLIDRDTSHAMLWTGGMPAFRGIVMVDRAELGALLAAAAATSSPSGPASDDAPHSAVEIDAGAIGRATADAPMSKSKLRKQAEEVRDAALYEAAKVKALVFFRKNRDRAPRGYISDIARELHASDQFQSMRRERKTLSEGRVRKLLTDHRKKWNPFEGGPKE